MCDQVWILVEVGISWLDLFKPPVVGQTFSWQKFNRPVMMIAGAQVAERAPLTVALHACMVSDHANSPPLPTAHRGDRNCLDPRKGVATRMADQGLFLDFNSSRLYSPKHLVFGKAVKVRHYPVTVSTEN